MTGSPAPPPDNFIVFGHISRPHGVHGAVMVTSYVDDLESISEADHLELLSPDGQIRRKIEARKAKSTPQGFIIKIETITSREDAAALKGWRIGLERQYLAEPDEDEVYWADLLGLLVSTIEGQELGLVTNLMEAGAGLLLVVTPADQPGAPERLIPFQQEFIASLDVALGRLVMDLPSGLLDL